MKLSKILGIILCLLGCVAAQMSPIGSCNFRGKQKSPESCMSYIECIDNKLYQYNCGRNLIFDENLYSCIRTKKNEDECEPSTFIENDKEKGDEFQCQENGYFADSTDCQRFYRCSLVSGKNSNHMIKHAFSCPVGLGFNVQRIACEPMETIVNCGIEGLLKSNQQLFKVKDLALKELRKNSKESYGLPEQTRKTQILNDKPDENRGLPFVTRPTEPHSKTDKEQYEQGNNAFNNQENVIKGNEHVDSHYQYIAGYANSFGKLPNHNRAANLNEYNAKYMRYPKYQYAYQDYASPISRKHMPISRKQANIQPSNTMHFEGREWSRDHGLYTPHKSKSVVSLFHCPYDGYFADKNDCTQFFHCTHGLAYTVRCIGGLYFNPKNNICDWPTRVPQCSMGYYKTFIPGNSYDLEYNRAYT